MRRTEIETIVISSAISYIAYSYTIDTLDAEFILYRRNSENPEMCF